MVHPPGNDRLSRPQSRNPSPLPTQKMMAESGSPNHKEDELTQTRRGSVLSSMLCLLVTSPSKMVLATSTEVTLLYEYTIRTLSQFHDRPPLRLGISSLMLLPSCEGYGGIQTATIIDFITALPNSTIPLETYSTRQRSKIDENGWSVADNLLLPPVWSIE